MNTATNDKIDSNSDVCPSCNSDSWKSAKMVVMEGTTWTTGTIDGTVTDPGRLSGSFKAFLLSDRWFSWDYPIEAKIGLSSSTGLVDEVKRLMVDHASALQMPSPPIRTYPLALKAPIPPKILKKPTSESIKQETLNAQKRFIKDLEIYNKAEAPYKKQYKKQLAEYKKEKSNFLKARESLWDRARICMRCGTAYLAGN